MPAPPTARRPPLRPRPARVEAVRSTDDGHGEQATIELPVPVDIAGTLAPHRTGRCGAADGLSVWRTTRTPDGPATARYQRADGGALRGAPTDRVRVTAWGPGAAWMLTHAADVLGAGDRTPFTPADRLVARLHRRHAGLRFGCNRSVVETLVPVILEQRVTTADARRSYARLVAAFGSAAPGPAGGRGLRCSPGPERLAELAYFDLHRFGVERRRAETILRVCRQAARYDALAWSPGPLTDDDTTTARRLLGSVPGIGPWTLAILAQRVFGDPDAVIVGDLHLPHLVSWNLAGEARGDDARMLELLAPFAGHRARVVRLLAATGNWAPRFAPGLPVCDIARL